MPDLVSSKPRKRSATWAAQFLVAAELERHGYDVAFTMGSSTPVADLMAGHAPTGEQFWGEVKGLWASNPRCGKANPIKTNLFYGLVLVGEDRTKDRMF